MKTSILYHYPCIYTNHYILSCAFSFRPSAKNRLYYCLGGCLFSSRPILVNSTKSTFIISDKFMILH